MDDTGLNASLDGSGLLSALPTELWYYVLSFLDPDDKMMFARASWLCFFMAFPNGVKIPDGPYGWQLKPFAEGGRLEGFRHRVHSVRFDITNISNSTFLFQKAAIFPDLRRIEINFVSSHDHLRSLFDGFFSVLSVQPYFSNLSHLAITWHPTYYSSRLLDEKKFLDSLEGKEFSKTMETIEFPPSLRSLTVFISQFHILLPLLTLKTITNLVLLYPIQDIDFTLPNIKNLTFFTQYSLFRLQLGTLPAIFPSVESFSFPRTRPGAPDENWLKYIPNFPRVKTLNLAWPQIDGKNADLNILETALQAKLSTSNDLRALEKITFCGFRDFAEHRRNIFATCMISRAAKAKPGEEWVFKWHGTISNYQDDAGYGGSLVDNLSGDEWEPGNTDGGDDENDMDIGRDLESEEEAEDEEEEEADDYDSEYFEHLAVGDELYVSDSSDLGGC
ncbi:hypothetical protein TWF730_010057 [Orbilia blumenaviensis]|uniref:F-box domain-containing protein n=1 Tax=Orbilia blumenaviensis TaxID=1796055 RepID=A0AAV9UX22_9PEZI